MIRENPTRDRWPMFTEYSIFRLIEPAQLSPANPVPIASARKNTARQALKGGRCITSPVTPTAEQPFEAAMLVFVPATREDARKNAAMAGERLAPRKRGGLTGGSRDKAKANLQGPKLLRSSK
jgi:hypothetical protein